MSAATRILAIVQLAPDIGTNDATYTASLIGQCMDFVQTFCVLDRFPDLAQGTSVSAAGASTDLSGEASNTLLVSVNSQAYTEIALTLANCTTGSLTAAEIQTQIRAANESDYRLAACTATYSAVTTQYTITNPVYGPASRVVISHRLDEWHCALALKLSQSMGGVETVGGYQDDAMEAIAAQMAINAYRRIKLAPSDYDTASNRQAQLNSAFWAEDETIKRLLLPRRRLVV